MNALAFELLVALPVVAVLSAVGEPLPSAPTRLAHEQQLQTMSANTAPTAMSTCASRGKLRAGLQIVFC